MGVTIEEQLDLQPDGNVPGRYRIDVSPEWNCPTVPQGGTMAAIAARAMGHEVGADDAFRLRSMTTVFAAAVPAGPVVVDVRVLRRGRSMSQALTTVRSPDSEVGHTSIAVFGRARPGFDFTDLTMPDVAGPDDCPSFRDPWPDDVELPEQMSGRPPFPFWEKVEGRAAMGHAPWEDYQPVSSDTAAWHRFDDPPMRSDGTLDPLALVVFADLMPSSVGEKVGPRNRHNEWYPPSTDLTVHLLDQPRSEWILGHCRARHSGEGYASLEIALWDPQVGLVAHASQVMYFVFPDGGPDLPPTSS